MSVFLRTGPASSRLLSSVIASSSFITDTALEKLATELPLVALDLAGNATSVRLNKVLQILSGRPEANDKRHGTLASVAITRLRQAIAHLAQTKLPYIPPGDPVPLALPWTITGGGRAGRPFVLHREAPEMCEWLVQAEVDHRAVEAAERKAAMYAPRRPLPWMKATANILEDEY
jgi:hypothetical protein